MKIIIIGGVAEAVNKICALTADAAIPKIKIASR